MNIYTSHTMLFHSWTRDTDHANRKHNSPKSLSVTRNRSLVCAFSHYAEKTEETHQKIIISHQTLAYPFPIANLLLLFLCHITTIYTLLYLSARNVKTCNFLSPQGWTIQQTRTPSPSPTHLTRQKITSSTASSIYLVFCVMIIITCGHGKICFSETALPLE